MGTSCTLAKARESRGGDKRDRTADLYNAIVALYQLSYIPDRTQILKAKMRRVNHLFSRLWIICRNFRRTQLGIELLPFSGLFFADPTQYLNRVAQAGIGQICT